MHHHHTPRSIKKRGHYPIRQQATPTYKNKELWLIAETLQEIPANKMNDSYRHTR